MSQHTTAFETWLVDYLTADATLTGLVGSRVYGNLAPPFPVLPLVRINFLPGANPLTGLSGRVNVQFLEYEILAVGNQNDAVALQPITDQLDDLLSPHTVDDTDFHATIVRQSEVSRPDVLQGTTRYSHAGAVYRVAFRPKY